MTMRARLPAFLLGLLPLVGAAEGPTPTPAQREFFEKEVRPVLAENCYSCHGPKKQKSGLRLDSRDFILKGGEVGPVVVPGNPAASRLILQRTLIEAGYVVAAVEDGAMALRVMRKLTFDAVLTDWMMPNMDGIELCEKIKLQKLGNGKNVREKDK